VVEGRNRAPARRVPGLQRNGPPTEKREHYLHVRRQGDSGRRPRTVSVGEGRNRAPATSTACGRGRQRNGPPTDKRLPQGKPNHKTSVRGILGVFSASLGRGMGGLLHPARHKTIVSGAEGVFSVSLGRGMVYLPLTARNEDPGNDDAPAPAPEPTPREKPKNHKISVSGGLGVFSASLGRGMVVLLSLFCCWRMCRRRGGSRAARTCTRAGPGAASKSRRRYNVVFDVSGVLPLDPGHAHAHVRVHAHAHA